MFIKCLFSRWEKVSDIPPTAKDCELVNLAHGIKYWFRLRNITLFGQSEPSFLGEPVVLKEVKGKKILIFLKKILLTNYQNNKQIK